MDNSDHLIPSVILSLLRGERKALTTGEQRWDYIYVEDVVNAIYKLAVAPGANGVFNLGSGTAHAIRTIVERVRDLIDPSLPLGFGEVPHNAEKIRSLQIDNSRLRQATDWSPQVSLDEGLRRTVEWYSKNYSRSAG
jgi:nucleoside-diphosphate-sugar epimerase